MADKKIRKDEVEPWRTSRAKGLLRQLLEEGTISLSDAPEKVYKLHNEFMKYKLSNFKTNFKNLALTVEKDKSQSAREEHALASDIALYNLDPIEMQQKKQQSATLAKLLYNDIENGRYQGVPPQQFQLSRKEYQEISLEKFRKKLYQIQRKFMQRSYWPNRASKDKQKKEEFAKLASELNFNSLK